MAPISFDDCLTKYLGEFGRHQKKVCLLSCLFSISNALFIMLMVGILENLLRTFDFFH